MLLSLWFRRSGGGGKVVLLSIRHTTPLHSHDKPPDISDQRELQCY